jgi:hypothetical protein
MLLLSCWSPNKLEFVLEVMRHQLRTPFPSPTCRPSCTTKIVTVCAAPPLSYPPFLTYSLLSALVLEEHSPLKPRQITYLHSATHPKRCASLSAAHPTLVFFTDSPTREPPNPPITCLFDCWVLFSRQGAEAPAAGILEFRPPGCPPVGSPQVPVPMGTLR